MSKFMYQLGWSIVCSILSCGLVLMAVTALFQQAAVADRSVFLAAVFLGSAVGFVNTLLISMTESLGFWSSASVKPYFFSGATFGVLLGFCVSGLGLFSALGLGVLVTVVTSIGTWIGARAAMATRSK